jgi:hypothetical protein
MKPNRFIGRLYFCSKVGKTIFDLQQKAIFLNNDGFSSEPVI